MEPIDEASIQRAFARLSSAQGYALTCGACGHSAPVRDDPEKSVYRCDECGAATCYGAEQPRVAVAPHADRRFVVLTVTQGRGARKNEVQLTFERRYAAGVALEVLSVVAPAQHAALLKMLSDGRDVPGLAADRADAALALDAPLAPPPRGPGRVPGPAAVDEGAGRCQCGSASEFPNGACRACHARALGIVG